MLYPSAERDLLDSLPCVGKVLSAVLALEIGDVRGRLKARSTVERASRPATPAFQPALVRPRKVSASSLPPDYTV
jgi:hypothetical protein